MKKCTLNYNNLFCEVNSSSFALLICFNGMHCSYRLATIYFEINYSGICCFRFICGTQDIHKSLEEQIAKFHNRDEAILYASCFDANAGFFETLLTKVRVFF